MSGAYLVDFCQVVGTLHNWLQARNFQFKRLLHIKLPLRAAGSPMCKRSSCSFVGCRLCWGSTLICLGAKRSKHSHAGCRKELRSILICLRAKCWLKKVVGVHVHVLKCKKGHHTHMLIVEGNGDPWSHVSGHQAQLLVVEDGVDPRSDG